MENEIKKYIAVQEDAWQNLRAHTAARIALGRAGTTIPLRESLRMKLAHAFARDAVYSKLATDELENSLAHFMLPIVQVNSKVKTRSQYLQRPDLGKNLEENSVKTLQNMGSKGYDVSIIIADGLSASAVNQHSIPVLKILIPLLRQTKYTIAPICIACQARVALADDIGDILGSRLSLILIGERPGLSSPHSMGAYITFQPTPGLTDESRNCISNIRPEGLGYIMAADKIYYMIQQSLRLLLSGVSLKEDQQAKPLNLLPDNSAQ